MSFRGVRIVLAPIAIVALLGAGTGCGSSGSVSTASTDTPTTTAKTASGSNSSAPPFSHGGAYQSSVPLTSDTTTSTTLPARPPATPTGSFLSSHQLSLANDGGGSRAQSTCTTTPGATCAIRFTKGSTTRSLDAQQVDVNGNTSWLWSPSTVGLSVGHWDVTVIAQASGATSTATDALGLTVVP